MAEITRTDLILALVSGGYGPDPSHGPRLRGVDLRKLDLSGLDLSGAEVTKADFRGATMEGIDVDSLENFERAHWDAAKSEEGDVYNKPQDWDK